MTSKMKVLIIEDEPDMAMGLRDNLEFEGFEVLTAASGEAGIQLATKEKPACMDKSEDCYQKNRRIHIVANAVTQ